MKRVLDLVAFKFEKSSDTYKYFKKQIMEYFYSSLKDFFTVLSSDKVVEKCPCGANLRNGYSPCKDCGGSGYKMKRNENET
ncbi:MAG: hypothetical protein R3321_04690 [Nitrososphaeraceae archaeon]|nr:hypothetical protein [Nitrososphaeraceae archaeon]